MTGKDSWRDGDALETQYRHTLEELGKGGGMLGAIFRKAQNKIQDPAKLKRLVSMMNEETWVALEAGFYTAIGYPTH